VTTAWVYLGAEQFGPQFIGTRREPDAQNYNFQPLLLQPACSPDSAVEVNARRRNQKLEQSKNSNKIQKNGWKSIRCPALKPISGEKSMTKTHDRIGHKCCFYLAFQNFSLSPINLYSLLFFA
jgi:hypothetical protein